MTDKTCFTYRPIGILQSPYSRRIDAPHQGTVMVGRENGEPALALMFEVVNRQKAGNKQLA